MKAHKRRTIKPVSVLIPNGFNISEYDLSDTGLVKDRIKLILHQLCLTRLMTISLSNSSNTLFEQGWTPLHSKILIKVGTDQYAKYLRWLIDNNVIEIRKNDDGTKNYSAKGKSQQFRLASNVLKSINGHIFHRETITDYKTVKATNHLKEYFAERPIKHTALALTDAHHRLVEMADQAKFNLDLLEQMRHAPDFLKSIPPAKLEMLDEYHELMSAINQGDIKFATVDRFGERLHTHFSNLWGVLRDFLYFKNYPNQELVVLDFANSQPYFSSICMTENFVQELLPEFVNCIPQIQDIQLEGDFNTYKKLCADGSIYDFWATARQLNRDMAKKEIIAHIMFGKPKSTIDIVRKARKAFGSHFPTVLKMFDKIKTMNEGVFPFIKDLYVDGSGDFSGRKALYKNLACMMQRAESRIVIGRIAPALIREGIEPMITVHDSFIVLERHQEKTRKIINEQFSQFGISAPKIKLILQMSIT